MQGTQLGAWRLGRPLGAVTLVAAGDQPQRLREDSEARPAFGTVTEELVAQPLLALAAVHLECTWPADLRPLVNAVLVYRLGEGRPRGVVGKLGSA